MKNIFKNNRKIKLTTSGFTLVELLAAIIILSLLALIASTSITKVVKNSKNDLYESQIQLIKSAAELWGADNINKLPDVDSCIYLTVGDLKGYGILDSEIVNSKTNKEISDDMLIKISSSETKYGSLKTTYEVDASDVSECIKASISFDVDDWETIIENIRSGNANFYNVGDTKKIKLTSSNTDVDGTYTVRISNMSTPKECKEDGFSQTACGIVIEFKKSILIRKMNSTNTSTAGWNGSEMRTFVNDTIYNSLPVELRNSIIDTKVVSGHSSATTDNFEITDKIYLLSPREVWGDDESLKDYDTAYDNTRQLDYYKKTDTTLSNSKSAIKGGSSWWLRTAYKSHSTTFLAIEYNTGKMKEPITASSETGLSPAFRIG